MPAMAPPAPAHAATTAGRERLLRLVEYAILAPSSHNSQPWTFAVSEDEIRIFVDRDHWLPMADPDQRELYVSIGCALENLLIAAERFGRTTRVWYDGGFDS